MLAQTDPGKDRGDEESADQDSDRWFLIRECCWEYADAYPADANLIAPFIADWPRCQIPRSGADGCHCPPMRNERPGPAGGIDSLGDLPDSIFKSHALFAMRADPGVISKNASGEGIQSPCPTDKIKGG